MRLAISAAAMLLVTTAARVESQAVPALYVSKGACPFECCTYREWTANRPVNMTDRPAGRVIARIAKGEVVLGITGEVLTHPLRYRIERNPPGLANQPDLAGSIVYLLHPLGEGFWLVWYHGKTMEIDPQYGGPDPRYQWWAKIRARFGQIGWVLMSMPDLPFDHVDLCG